MATSNLNVRLDNELRSQATQVFSDYGLTPTQAIKLFFNQVVRTQQIPLSFDYLPFDYQQKVPNLATQQAMLEALQERNTAKCYDSVDEMMKDIQEFHA